MPCMPKLFGLLTWSQEGSNKISRNLCVRTLDTYFGESRPLRHPQVPYSLSKKVYVTAPRQFFKFFGQVQSISAPKRQNTIPLLLVKLRYGALKFLIHFSLFWIPKYLAKYTLLIFPDKI